MERMIDREVAWRIFAHEFNRSNLHLSGDDDRAPNYLITPTGAKCNRIFIVGVVTEVENIGKDNNLWRARIADPTGVFTLYAGQYQPEAAIFLSELQVPGYVAVVGKARKYEPDDRSVYTSVRPEEINTADEKQRDRWVLDTAERTLERITLIEEALKSGLSGNALKELLLRKAPLLADGIARAIENYKNLDKYIDELKNAIIHAVETVSSEREKPIHEQPVEKIMEPQVSADERRSQEQSSPQPEIKEEKVEEPEIKDIVATILDKLDTGQGVYYSLILEIALSDGIDAESVESGIKQLMAEGRCYEPKLGVLRKVQE